jgi:RimJ/RimL family protein N-acetyltransferase
LIISEKECKAKKLHFWLDQFLGEVHIFEKLLTEWARIGVQVTIYIEAGTADMMKPPDEIRTNRPLLRKIKEDDADSIWLSLAQDIEVTKYLSWMPRTNIEQVRDFVRRRIEDWQDNLVYTWAICLSEGSLIGLIDLELYKSTVLAGLLLERKSWNKGIATEALQTIIKWAMDQPAIFRVWAFCDVENIASIRVLEKVGMIREGILHRWRIHPNISSIPRDCFSYACYK